MKPSVRFHTELWLLIVVLALLTGCVLNAQPAPKQALENQLMPDVLIWIDARNQYSAFVGIIYPKVVSRAEAETAVASLLRETGWAAQNISISNGSATNPGEKPMTAVDLNTTAPLSLTTGYLPIEPFVKAFRNNKLVEIQYVLPQQFIFKGLGNYENKYVNIKLVAGNSAYRYSVRIKDKKFESLNLPTPSAPSVKNSSERDQRLAVKILVVLLALITAVIVFMIAKQATKGRMK